MINSLDLVMNLRKDPSTSVSFDSSEPWCPWWVILLLWICLWFRVVDTACDQGSICRGGRGGPTPPLVLVNPPTGWQNFGSGGSDFDPPTAQNAVGTCQ